MKYNNYIKSKRLGADVNHRTQPFSVRVTQNVAQNYIVDVWDELECLTDVEDALFALSVAEEHDTVTIQLNCSGGCMFVGDALLMAMRNCKANVHVIASGRVASFATFILLNADSFEISPYTEILCHSASFGSAGKMADTKEHVDFVFNQCKFLLEQEYRFFLTDEEIVDLIDNKREMYMTVEEFLERFEERNSKMIEEMQALDQDPEE